MKTLFFLMAVAYAPLFAHASPAELPARVNEAMIDAIANRCVAFYPKAVATDLTVDEYEGDDKEEVYRTEFRAWTSNYEGSIPIPTRITVTVITEPGENAPITIHGVEANYGGICR